MSTATMTSFNSLLSNPLLEGKEIKAGIHTISKLSCELLQRGAGAMIKKDGIRLLTSPIQYWEIVNEQYGVLVTLNSIYKVQVIE